MLVLSLGKHESQEFLVKQRIAMLVLPQNLKGSLERLFLLKRRKQDYISDRSSIS